MVGYLFMPTQAMLHCAYVAHIFQAELTHRFGVNYWLTYDSQSDASRGRTVAQHMEAISVSPRPSPPRFSLLIDHT